MNTKTYLNKIVQFNEKFSEQFGDFTGLDNKMKARITSITRAPDCDDETAGECYKVIFDFSEFIEYNKQFEECDFYTAIPDVLEKWSNTNYYPKNFKEDLYLYESDFKERMVVLDKVLIKELNQIKEFIKNNNLTEADKYLNL